MSFETVSYTHLDVYKRQMQDILPIYRQSRVSLFGFARPFMADPNFLHTLQKQI